MPEKILRAQSSIAPGSNIVLVIIRAYIQKTRHTTPPKLKRSKPVPIIYADDQDD